MEQLNLFGDKLGNKVERHTKGTAEYFHDYESFVAKFNAVGPKTTDDCYTPEDVYRVIVQWINDNLMPLEDKKIIRPFYPGGDYINEVYPADGVVIDNPPFSIFTKIVKFYAARKIPFFLFGPGLTILQAGAAATVVIAGRDIKYENGATVPTEFATNLAGDTQVIVASELREAIEQCESQYQKRNTHNKVKLPDNVVSISFLRHYARANGGLWINKNECLPVRKLQNAPAALFGMHLLVSDNVYKAIMDVVEKTRVGQTYELSTSEKQIITKLNEYD
jgi:hypothetical protein